MIYTETADAAWEAVVVAEKRYKKALEVYRDSRSGADSVECYELGVSLTAIRDRYMNVMREERKDTT